MVKVTTNAVRKVKRLLAEQGTPAMGLRLAIRGGGCSGLSYFMDFAEQPQQADIVLDFEGLPVYVDPKSATVLDEVEVDFVEGIQDHGFQFRNPKAKSSCGCGTSFSV